LKSVHYLWPIGWEHVNPADDYTLQAVGRLRKGSFRPLRPVATFKA